MVAPVNTYQGVSSTDRFLTVYFRSEFGGSVRFCEVKVPIGDLCVSDVGEAMGRETRRRLVEAWSGVNVDPPLFEEVAPWSE